MHSFSLFCFKPDVHTHINGGAHFLLKSCGTYYYKNKLQGRNYITYSYIRSIPFHRSIVSNVNTCILFSSNRSDPETIVPHIEGYT